MNRYTGYVVFLFLMVLLCFASCTDDPAPAPADPRLAFEGLWTVNETETRLTYEAYIELDPGDETNSGVLIKNFANAGSVNNTAYAYVSGNQITLKANQIVGDGWEVKGSGVLSGSTINWPYTLDDGANLHHITATFTRP